MISFSIKDIKNFMSCLLVGSTFDFFTVKEATLSMDCSFSFDGHINSNFFDKDELELFKGEKYVQWTRLKPVCYSLIKGTKTPDKFKITFSLPKSEHNNIIERSQVSFSEHDIDSFYIHFNYENGILTAITATSLNIFTMEKSLDHYWDETVKKFLLKHFNVEENS